jgi:hypothetical protein
MIALMTAATLAALPQLSWADRDDRDRRWDRDDRREYRQHRRYRDDRHLRRHRPPHYRHYRPYWNQRWYYGPRHYRRDWGSAYLGGALLGSAITYSLSHNHANCTDSSHYHGGSSRYEVSGCYRIERLPDGREVRVELPLSACR